MHRVHFNRIERLVPRRVGVVVVHHHHHRRRLRNRVDAISIGVHHSGTTARASSASCFWTETRSARRAAEATPSLVFERVPSFLRRHDDDDDDLLLLLLLPKLFKRFVAFKDDGRHKTEGREFFVRDALRDFLLCLTSPLFPLSLSLFLSFAVSKTQALGCWVFSSQTKKKKRGSPLHARTHE